MELTEEEAKHKDKIRKLARWRQFFAAFAATIGTFSLGTVLAWHYGPDILQSPTDEQLLLLLSAPAIGGTIAGFVGGICIEAIGRKRTMIIFSVLSVLGWIFVGMVGNHFVMTLIGRFLTGFGGGICLLTSIAYISETADPGRRGCLLCLVQITIFSGYLFTDIFSNIVRAKALAYICGIFPALFLSMVMYIPESPRYLVSKGRIGQAAKSVSWLRGTYSQDVITAELQRINRSVDLDRSRARLGCFKRIFGRPVLKPFVISTILMIMVTMSGFGTILTHRQFLLSRNGIHLNPNMLLIIMGATLVLCTTICALLVDRVGRRLLLILSGTLTTAALATLGTYYFINHAQILPPGRKPTHGWIPVGSFFSYVFGFSLGIGPLPWVLMGEILPPNLKGYYLAPFISSWFLAQWTLESKWNVIRSLDVYWKFWIYALFCFLSTIFLLCTVPETKKKSLTKIEQFFAPKIPAYSAKLSSLSMTCRNIEGPHMAPLMSKPTVERAHPIQSRPL